MSPTMPTGISYNDVLERLRSIPALAFVSEDSVKVIITAVLAGDAKIVTLPRSPAYPSGRVVVVQTEDIWP